MNNQVTEFLNKHKISPESFTMEELCSHILDEMQNALDGKKSSMPMINSYCTPTDNVPSDEPVIVIDAGGTNFRTCLIHFDKDKKPIFEDFRVCAMPGSQGEVSAKEFFSIIADEIERLVDKSDRIGFCFSYAAQILPDHDGYPLFFSKEIKAPQVINKHLGKELLKELKRRGHNVDNKKVIIMNDTVTTLLAGLSELEKNNCGSCVGFILGTGTNAACTINGTIINEESGNLTFSLGDIDERFLNGTNNPEHYHFEKMISGAYLGPLAFEIIKQACEEGLFSEGFVKQFSTLDTLQTKHLSDFLRDQESPLDQCINTNEDTTILKDIILAFLERVAKLTAANLAASVIASDKVDNKPVLINADGTTFYKTEHLKEFTEKHLKSYLKEKGLSVVFTQIESSPAVGAAIGALSI